MEITRKVKNNPKRFLGLFRDRFAHLDPEGPEGPGRLLMETLSGFRAKRAREAPVRGGRGCSPFPKLEEDKRAKWFGLFLLFSFILFSSL